MRGVRWRDEAGATAVEYGLVAAFVGVLLVTAGPMLQGAFLTLLDAVLCGILGGATCP